MKTRPGQVALVVPSIREESFKRFIREWSDTGLPDQTDLILMEDNPHKTFEVNEDIRGFHHLCWEDIDTFDWSWIIPRRSDTVRSFAYWWAWRNRYDYIMTLDDDCYPSKDYQDLVGGHLSMMERTRWFCTLNSVRPRGIPYKNLGHREVHVNHGIWQGILDYDAPQQLVNPVPEVYSHDNRIVPAGAYFPMCGMNVMWRREATVLMYHLLMGRMVGRHPGSEMGIKPHFLKASSGQLDLLPFDRFGDIWCGILMKKVADHLGWSVSTGTPYIHHDRASDPFTNLRKEANGIQVNEWFWEKVDAVLLPHGGSAVDCYIQLGLHVRAFGGEHEKYWYDLGNAMVAWAELFRE